MWGVKVHCRKKDSIIQQIIDVFFIKYAMHCTRVTLAIAGGGREEPMRTKSGEKAYCILCGNRSLESMKVVVVKQTELCPKL